MSAHIRLKTNDLISSNFVQMRLQLEIYVHDEPAYPLATFQFESLFYERHRVFCSTDSITTAVRLRYTGCLCDTKFRIIRGEPTLG